MQFSKFLLVAAAGIASAQCLDPSKANACTILKKNQCLTDACAAYIVDGLRKVITFDFGTRKTVDRDYAATVFAPTYSEFSDSVNTISGIPLGVKTFANRTVFLDGIGSQPPFPSANTLNIFHSCNIITWRWHAGFTPVNMQGISIYNISKPYTGLIDNIFAEFNTAAILKDVGAINFTDF